MKKYQIRFWFEHGGACLWGINDNAKERYGYSIKNEELPISVKLVKALNALEKEYSTCLNWDDPAGPSPWSNEHKQNFLRKANEIYIHLQKELGPTFEVINKIDQCV